MPSTYTVNLGIEKPATGEQSGTWGDTTNVNFDILDQAINGAERVTLTSAGSSGSPNALNITNGATSDGRNKWIEFYSSGDLGGSVYVQLVPNDAEKIVFVRNSLASSRSILLFQGTYNSGRDLEIPAGVDMVVKFDGGGASAATVTDVFTKLRATEITTPTLTATTADINGGTIDNSVIGGSTAAAVTGTAVVANTSLNIAGDGATVTGIKDEDNMASNSATKLATQQSIKAYVDSQVGTVDTWAEVLANGATSGSTNPEVTAGQALKTNTINETSAGSGVTIDSVLLKDDVVNATDVETGSISANDGTASATIANSTGLMTIASSVLTTTDINAGTIDNSTIGGSTPAVGTFTQVNVDSLQLDGAVLSSSSSLTLDIAGNLTINVDGTTVSLSDDTINFGQFYQNSSGNFNIYAPTSNKDLLFLGNDGGSTITALTLDMSNAGAATFNSRVGIGVAPTDILLGSDYGTTLLHIDGGSDRGQVIIEGDTLAQIVMSDNGATADSRVFLAQVNDGTMIFKSLSDNGTSKATIMSMTSAGATSFSGAVTANAGVVVDNITIDGNEIDVSSGDLTLDAAGNIVLDADGGGVYFKDGGTNIGFLQNSGANDFRIVAGQVDKDIVFMGNDGGSVITALTLDMSDGGEAYFAKNIHATSAFLTTTNNEPQLTLISTDADADVGPILKLYRNSASPADGDVLGRIQWSGEDDAGNDSTFARLTVTATDVSNGAETAKMVFAPATSDAFPDALTLTGDGAAFNDDLFVGSTITGYDDITGGAGLAIGSGSVTTAGIMIRTGATGTGRIYFGDNSGNAAGRKAGRIEYSHSAEEMTVFSTGSLILDSVTGVLDFDDNGTNIGRFENSSSDFKMESRVQDKDIVFVGNDGGSGINALVLDMSAAGAATFNSTGTFAGGATNFDNTADVVTLNGSLHTRLLIDTSSTGGHQAAIVLESNGNQSTIGNTGSNTSFAVAAGNLTLDVAGNIILDADGGEVKLHDGGTIFANLYKSSNNFVVSSAISDADIIFKGVDSGSTITALTLDMSEAGQATFNNGIKDVFVTGSITPLIVRATNPTSTDKWGMYAQYRSASVNGDGAGMSLGLHNASGAEAEYVYFGAIIEDNTAGSQDGSFIIAPVTNGSRNEVVRVTSTNQVLIDLTSIPTAGNGHDSKLVVNQTGSEYNGITLGSGFNVSTIANNAYDLVLTANAYPANTGSVQAIKFKAGTSGGGGPNQIGQIDQNGMHFGTDTAADTGLDDYEEGAWTGTATAGAATSISVVDEKYTKIGNQVTIQCTINFSGASGALAIAGLPFATSPASVGIGREDATSGYAIYGRAQSGGTTFNLFFAGGTGNATPFQVSAGNMRYSMTYLT